jgi:hypothetical protein
LPSPSWLREDARTTKKSKKARESGRKAGMNTATFKYFIDFASANRLEYVVIDGGWSFGSLMQVNPEIDLAVLIEYGWAAFEYGRIKQDGIFSKIKEYNNKMKYEKED